MKWCFDSSALIEPWVRLYPPDIFGPVWEKLDELIAVREIIAPQDVLLELEKQKDDLHGWASERPEFFIEPNREVMESYADIVNAYPGFMKVNSTKSGADPFVVATAEVHELSVVTYETHAKKDAAPKIPNVCDHRNIKFAQIVEVLRDSGFKL